MEKRSNIPFARKLRNTGTDAESKFWQSVRARQLAGWKFRRQFPYGPYVVDFICLDAKMIVELDGGQHAEHLDYDAARTQFLESAGFRVLRFWDHDVLRNLNAVLEQLLYVLAENHPHPNPLPPAEEGEGAE